MYVHHIRIQHDNHHSRHFLFFLQKHFMARAEEENREEETNGNETRWRAGQTIKRDKEMPIIVIIIIIIIIIIVINFFIQTTHTLTFHTTGKKTRNIFVSIFIFINIFLNLTTV